MKNPSRNPLILLFLLLLAGCGGGSGVEPPSLPLAPSQPAAPVSIDKASFFPFSTGTSWHYTIEVRDPEPVAYDQILWPLSADQVLGQGIRRRFASVMSGGKQFELVLEVKGPAPQQGPLNYPTGVELTVVTDTLGLYQDVTHIYWAIRLADQASGFAVEKVEMYDVLGPRAPTGSYGSLVSGDGYTHRMAFFDEDPGTNISFGNDAPESLTYLGVEMNAPGYAAGPLLHFRREVAGSTENTGTILDSEFTEDMWFAKDKGLVVLEQKIGGKTSMIWTLSNPVP